MGNSVSNTVKGATPDLDLQQPQPWVGPAGTSLNCGISYEPLRERQSIRLLKLHLPCDPDNPEIECTLTEHFMPDCQNKYVALSYTWGDSTARKQIKVNGRPAFITENLYEALTHILSLDGDLASLLESHDLWVDALCINQQDAAEKSVQVANMLDVFSNADWVVAWMGPSADGSDELLQGMRKAVTVDTPESDLVLDLSPQALKAFLDRGWWNRMWILQEFMMSRKIWFLCGQSSVDADVLTITAHRWLLYLSQAPNVDVEPELRDLLTVRMTLMIGRDILSWKGMSFPMIYWIDIAKEAQCTDPRDKIFALLGLMWAGEKEDLICDYNASPCEVFSSAIRVMALHYEEEITTKVVKMVNAWKLDDHRGGSKLQEHDPLEPHVPARQTCDGIACSSQFLCISIPEHVQMSGRELLRNIINEGLAKKQSASSGGS
ncbi:heterokaryon incompatibility protein-domain-containing protein [Cercophora samala]|uniref:Heterokaryon incompatibility protein-domain-containing protein n=1 Tax=Cercophora samala TaxID=330535 RepID=A0AA39Z2C2_9PEZI|nr:heterokaryon incompatibility protein-domain-containing protein [Cercophora samala]